jgi:N-acetylmuramoyl-L-alanine amidase
VRPKASGNVNLAEDRRFAERVLHSAHRALLELDPKAKNRGVFEKPLGVLRDDFLGNTPAKQPCRACLLELEFLDVPEVDALFNTGPNAENVKQRVATAIAAALIEEVGG